MAVSGVSITKNSDARTISVSAPFHPDFAPLAKHLGGRWARELRQWQFDARDEERVRALLIKIFGTDGAPVPLVSVRRKLTREELREREFWRYGRCLASRSHRDAQVRLGEGVVIVDGTFPARAGSAKYPALAGYSDPEVTLEIRDVPASLVNSEDGDEIVSEAAVDTATKPDPWARVTDEELIAVLQARGYTVTR